jgi:hypothetical protein
MTAVDQSNGRVTIMGYDYARYDPVTHTTYDFIVDEDDIEMWYATIDYNAPLVVPEGSKVTGCVAPEIAGVRGGLGGDVVVVYHGGEGSPLSVEVTDVSGRLVRAFDVASESLGEHLLRWNGGDNDGRRVASGIYWVRIRNKCGASSRKMAMIH